MSSNNSFIDEDNVITVHSDKYQSNLEFVLNFQYSFGYNCQKLFNLVSLDDENIAFSSGCYVHFLNIITLETKFIRSTLNQTIGHIAVNASKKHIAIGENGVKPTIFIYEWPQMNLCIKLKKGAKKSFQFLNYSPSTEFLASQSGEPDYLLTIWNWAQESVILRAQSHVNDVYKIIFSSYQKGLMSTYGRSHIKFWKMIDTFTGLKLKGELGRFGSKDICDIIGAEILPDQTVLSGDDKGNILIWEGGLIRNQFQNSQDNSLSLHNDIIVDILYKEENDKKILITVGKDGKILVWNYNQISETCLINDSEDVVLSKLEHQIKSFDYPFIKILSIVPYCDEKWFVQDGHGAIWCLNMSETQSEPQRIYKAHAGSVNDLISCPIIGKNYIVSAGDDGQLIVYNYKLNSIIFHWQFKAKSAEKIIWLPIENMNCLIMAFNDGSLRVCILSENFDKLNIIQIIKTHSKCITVLEMDFQKKILVTASKDGSLFFYRLEYISSIKVEPIGFLKLNDIITCLYWLDIKNDFVKVLIGCVNGTVGIINVELNDKFKKFDDFGLQTYEIKDFGFQFEKFQSCKSKIKHEQYLNDLRVHKENEKLARISELKELTENNPEFNFNEQDLVDDVVVNKIIDEGDTQWVPYIPKIPGNILFIELDIESESFWTSVSGFDCGYKYEFNLKTLKMIDKTYEPIFGAENEQIFCMSVCNDGKYSFYGMESGAIRISLKNGNYYNIYMHGMPITKITLSADDKYLFSAGKDGLVFSYKLELSNSLLNNQRKQQMLKISQSCVDNLQFLNDKDMTNAETLENLLQNERLNRQQKLADEYKMSTLEYIKSLQNKFETNVKTPNSLLPKQLQLNITSLSNKKINNHFNNWKNKLLTETNAQIEYELEKASAKYQKIFDEFIDSQDHQWPATVKGINVSITVSTIKFRALTKDIEKFQEIITESLDNEEDEMLQKLWNYARRKSSVRQSFLGPRFRSTISEAFMCNLPNTIFKTEPKLKRLLTKYRQRRKYSEIRQSEWDEFNKKKPISKSSHELYHPEDLDEIKHAIKTIGDFKFKTTFETCSKISNEKFTSVLHKSKELIDKWLELNKMINKFNQRIFDLIEMRNYLKPNEKQLLEDNFLIKKSLEKYENNSDNESENSIEYKNFIEIVDSDWYREQLEYDKLKIDFRNEQISKKETEKVKKFDKDIITLNAERKKLMVDMVLMKLHILALNQELKISKKYENDEKGLINVIEENEFEMTEIQKEIESDDQEVQMKKIELEQLKESEQNIHQEFESLILDNKFGSFLRTVFTMKLKTNLDEISESSEGTELVLDNTNEKSDIIECPVGCDSHIYQLILSLRDQRYEIEFRIEEVTEILVKLKQSVEKKIEMGKLAENSIKDSETKLFRLQKSKLDELNNIENVAILRLKQINTDTVNDLDADAILFTNEQFKKQFQRISELKVETLELNNSIKTCKIDINKIEMESKQWQAELKILKNKLNNNISTKFKDAIQSVQEINEMNEFIIRRLVHRIRLQQIEDEIHKKFKCEIQKLKLEFKEKKAEYLEMIKKNTCRNEILAWLQSEINNKQENNKSNVKKEYIDYDKMQKELEYYEKISNWQINKIKNLNNAYIKTQNTSKNP